MTYRPMSKGTSFPASPAEGDLFYRTDEHKVYVYNGSAWIVLGPYYQQEVKMGFSWTPINVGDEVKAVHINEIKDNIDTIYSDLELSPRDWSELPVSAGDPIRSAELQELRDAIDYADDQNYCRSHDATYYSGDDADDKEGVDGAYHSGYNNGYDPGVDGSYKTGYNSGVQVGVDGAFNSTVDSGDQAGVDGDHYSEVDSGDQTGVDSEYESPVDTVDDITHKASFYSTYYNYNFPNPSETAEVTFAQALLKAQQLEHYQKLAPEISKKELKNFILSNYGTPKILQVGYQPRFAEVLSKNFELKIVDMDKDNIGKIVNGVRIYSETETEDFIEWADLLFVENI